MTDKILFIDTETGGIDPLESSLLSIGLVVWCENEILDSKELFLNDGRLKVTKEALKVNKINIETHRKKALPSQQVITELIAFLRKHFDFNESITLAGHNVNFDVNFLKFFLERNNQKFSNYFSHRIIDTSSILYYLYLSGKLKHRALSSSDAFSYFRIPVENRHSALGDAVATAKLFTRLIQLMNKKLKSNIDDLTGQSSLF